MSQSCFPKIKVGVNKWLDEIELKIKNKELSNDYYISHNLIRNVALELHKNLNITTKFHASSTWISPLLERRKANKLNGGINLFLYYIMVLMIID